MQYEANTTTVNEILLMFHNSHIEMHGAILEQASEIGDAISSKNEEITLGEVQNMTRSFEDIAREVFSIADESNKEINNENKHIYNELLNFQIMIDIQSKRADNTIKELRSNFQTVSWQRTNLAQLIVTKTNELDMLRICYAGDNARLTQMIREKESAESDLRKAQKDLEEYQNHNKEFEMWCWVPGYNLYLMGRKIEESVNNIVPMLSKKIDRTIESLIVLQLSVENTAREIDEFDGQIQNICNEIVNKEEEIVTLIQQEYLVSSEVVFYQNWGTFFGKLRIEVESLEDKNRVFQIFINSLSVCDEVLHENDDVYITYKEAFLHLARLLDVRLSELI